MDGGSERFEQLIRTAEAARARHGIPGMAVGVIEGPRSWTRGLGRARVDADAAVDSSTRFQLASVTKTFTCAAIMRLVEQGQLSLDTRVRELLPELKLADEGAAARVTIGQLLGHLGGFEGDLYVDTGDDELALARALARMVELRQLVEPGQLWSYCNAGYTALARVLERRTGLTAERALELLVLEPLGLRETSFASPALTQLPHARGHFTSKGVSRVAEPFPIPRAGLVVMGLATTIGDLLRWQRSWLEASLLERATIERVWTSCGQGTGQMHFEGALAWQTTHIAGEQVVGAGGVALGQNARMVSIPARGLGLALLSNDMRGAFAHRELVDTWLREHLGEGLPQPEPLALPRAQLEACAGEYERRGAQLRVEAEGSGLRIHVRHPQGFPDERLPAPPPSRAQLFVPYAADKTVLRAAVFDGPRAGELAEFHRDASGRVRWARLAMRLHQR